jgi:1,4-dihydroxy-2-naphthoate octaprenyltransferase
VKRAAFVCLGLAALVGLVLAATTAWWLVAVGALSILAAWLYTGGSRPYGYLGLGEVMVFVFFGLVAVLGTWFVQVHDHTVVWVSYAPVDDELSRSTGWTALVVAIGVGALACAILVANNLRDIPTDTVAGKRTLAVTLGDHGTRRLYVLLLAVALVMLARIAIATSWWAALGVLGFLPLLRAAVVVSCRAVGRDLVPVLQLTGLGELLYAAGLFTGLLLAR